MHSEWNMRYSETLFIQAVLSGVYPVGALGSDEGCRVRSWCFSWRWWPHFRFRVLYSGFIFVFIWFAIIIVDVCRMFGHSWSIHNPSTFVLSVSRASFELISCLFRCLGSLLLMRAFESVQAGPVSGIRTPTRRASLR